ncbi:band 3 anion transport protein isoform X9 [Anopheles gambiae]|uniref:band 3 anion transport protein isoform X9 n=1 Tax=Anopheles gambiae TaxID=7165 RepID=UPI002AC96E76|nr:band 3 anion transport protein isoform X9 [Anopheles gambiae]XP_061496851.1 band 3 anion transport protein isoform X9 [Anopheles gambiae]XP_061496852.1 band 3 anion transport protein isoform X9 [Anopheles gambiae]
MSRRDNNVRKLSFLGFHTKETSNDDPNEVHLDDEIERVFGTTAEKERFELNRLQDEVILDNSPLKYDEAHRVPDSADATSSASNNNNNNNNSSSTISNNKPSASSNEQQGRSKPVAASPPTTTPTSPISFSSKSEPTDTKLSSTANNTTLADNTSNDFSETVHDEPVVDQGTVQGEQWDTSARRNVHFDKDNKGAPIEGLPLEDTNEERRRRTERHHPHKSRKFSLQEYHPEWRRQSGTEGGPTGRRISVQPEDATLQEADIDELTSHRSDDPRALRRHKVSAQSGASLVNINRKEAAPPLQHLLPSSKYKKMYDHSPHEVFVQLDELTGSGEDREWKETARWIKYEEDVEEGADRWGRPHVASLSFHSLLNLRRCLETGVVLMDLEEKDLPSVAYRVVEQMVVDELIHEDDKAVIMRALLLRHRHVNESSHGGFSFGPKRKYSSYTSLQSVDDKKPRIVPATEINGHGGGHGETRINISEETYTSSQEDIKMRTQKESILKRIPEGAEATTVLVGAVDFLEQPTIAFVRLAEGIPMPSITEVPIPVRFLFILLGPQKTELDYHEVGRSIATLMSNEHFHDIAYKADDRRELLSAINEFLDDSIVLPPGKWERQALLPFEELKAKSDMIRLRKKKALDEKIKSKQSQLLTSEEEKKLLAAAGGAGDGGGGGDGKKPPKNPLEKTNRLWGGLINDIKRRYPMYKSDIMDGLNTETLAATIFMYFAALSTAITFGGLSSDKTHNLIGISETLVSASMVGLVFHLLAGQPLVIIGTTGPLLLFDEALNQFCISNDFSFLTVRVYVGCWLAVIALVVSAFEGSVYVRLFTRFTQEIFSALITLIYIVETVMKLLSVYKRHPLLAEYLYKNVTEPQPLPMPYLEEERNGTTPTSELLAESLTTAVNGTIAMAQDAANLLIPEDGTGPLNRPNTALFCTILTLGTFSLAYYLKLFRNSHFLGRNARRALGDFGVPISIALFVLVDYMIPQVYTEKLSVPEGLSPSDETRRGWIIPLGGVPGWMPFVAGIPALLVYILIFMETHISELIVDKPERGLKKGSGLHMDIVLLCFLNTVCGFFGMPWHCAATVRSVTHVSAVTIMSRTHAPGDAPHITDVKEQRISGFFVSLMVGLSVTMAPILRLIPMSVLFGVFLYMGIASMSGVQFFERLRLYLMPVKHHPQVPFVRRVPTWKMHLFTFVQILALAMLWAVKSSPFSLAFPFFLIMMVPIRKQLESIFSPLELRALDGSQPNEGAEDEPDFYEQAPIPA